MKQHPGKILKEQFLEKFDMSQRELASIIGVPNNRIVEIVRGRRRITADTDLRLSKHFGLDYGYWMNLQSAYEIDAAWRKSSRIIARIAKRI